MLNKAICGRQDQFYINKDLEGNEGAGTEEITELNNCQQKCVLKIGQGHQFRYVTTYTLRQAKAKLRIRTLHTTNWVNEKTVRYTRNKRGSKELQNPNELDSHTKSFCWFYALK